MSNSISLILNALNEEEFIGDCLRAAAPYVDECIVIDHGSTDQTIDIALSIPGVMVRKTGGHNFLTLGEKYFRDLQVSLCHSTWLMVIDADEIMSDGWHARTKAIMETEGDAYGMLNVDYWQMVGSYEYHTPDSPLPNLRPTFIRKHPGLQGTTSLNGTRCHSHFVPFIYPPRTLHLPSEIACFHLGYMKKDMVQRFDRNIERGDWGTSAEVMRQHRAEVQKDFCRRLPEAVPSRLQPAQYPSCMRERLDKVYEVDYDTDSRRIISRKLLEIAGQKL